MTDSHSDARIVASWQKNAAPWADAIRNDQIESRRLVTNAAIVEAVLNRKPQSVLDIGCGEGWLARALTAASAGIRVHGVDVVPALIEQAREQGGGDFRVASYEDIAAGKLQLRVDVAVANFSLIGEASVHGLIERAPALLNPGGYLIIQTLHPLVAGGDEPYKDGWRSGSWTGFSDDFTDPAPWYFRTIESWVALLSASGLHLAEIREPMHPGTLKPASIIFVAQTSG
jgi:2-polyprenyl-3-methyl-5-hydroxy-6-metoxy-1,4-benzoquinol methylase